ncbi:MAG: hypothetical protein JXA30_19495 [Deltaproteobacteria bacterium]|nr:hypothetical protein [Deltaproteobacteria bacterium]
MSDFLKNIVDDAYGRTPRPLKPLIQKPEQSPRIPLVEAEESANYEPLSNRATNHDKRIETQNRDSVTLGSASRTVGSESASIAEPVDEIYIHSGERRAKRTEPIEPLETARYSDSEPKKIDPPRQRSIAELSDVTEDSNSGYNNVAPHDNERAPSKTSRLGSFVIHNEQVLLNSEASYSQISKEPKLSAKHGSRKDVEVSSIPIEIENNQNARQKPFDVPGTAAVNERDRSGAHLPNSDRSATSPRESNRARRTDGGPGNISPIGAAGVKVANEASRRVDQTVREAENAQRQMSRSMKHVSGVRSKSQSTSATQKEPSVYIGRVDIIVESPATSPERVSINSRDSERTFDMSASFMRRL